MCDTQKSKIQKCDIRKLLFLACDILTAHMPCMWYLIGDHQKSAISVISACYTNRNVYIETGNEIEGVTIKCYRKIE